jgi:hypothetical protein
MNDWSIRARPAVTSTITRLPIDEVGRGPIDPLRDAQGNVMEVANVAERKPAGLRFPTETRAVKEEGKGR